MEDKIEKLNERLLGLEKQMDVLIKLFGGGISNYPSDNLNSSLGDGDEDNGLKYLLRLTPKQTATLQMIHEGYSTKEISKALDATDSTTKTHIAALFKKFKARERSQLVLKTIDLFNNISEEIYLSHAGIPKDFAKTLDEKTPNKYRDMLRKQRKQ
tara:strand:+ start:1427 stop:1894 length:468 start_codon:yes stop_codon:yes gene_type:complete